MAFTDDQKREVIERVARNVRDFGYFDGTLDITEEVLDAANYFELREAAESVCKETRIWLPRTESSWVWEELADALAALKAALKGGGESE